MKSLTNKQISFSVFNEADHSSQKFSVSQSFFFLSVFFICASVCLTGFIAIRSHTLKRALPSPVLLKEAKSNQAHLISQQKEQISLLTAKLETLSDKFEQLQEMKNEICKIGRIEQPVKRENLFGIGGSRAETITGNVDSEIGNNPDCRFDAGQASPESLHKDKSFDPGVLNGRTLVLDRSDFFINPIACIPSSSPINGDMTQELQKKRQLITQTNDDSNRGVLLEVLQGSDVMAPANGIITFVDHDNDSGETVIIDHGHGYITRYTSLKYVAQKRGALVLKGDVIGQAQTGSSEEPAQFYYEIILNGLPVNPEKYISHYAFLL